MVHLIASGDLEVVMAFHSLTLVVAGLLPLNDVPKRFTRENE